MDSTTILLVDDDGDLRQVTATLLSMRGYRVIEADAGDSALNLLNGGVHADLVLTDFLLPGMSGLELAAQVSTRRP